MKSVIDSSAILAVLFGEPGRETVVNRLDDYVISAANLAEVITKLVESGYSDDQAERTIDAFLPNVVPLNASIAIETGKLRRSTRRLGLSLGDRCCLATAKENQATAVTADRKWANLDIGCEIEIIR